VHLCQGARLRRERRGMLLRLRADVSPCRRIGLSRLGRSGIRRPRRPTTHAPRPFRHPSAAATNASRISMWGLCPAFGST
jgi:hypothetical protein